MSSDTNPIDSDIRKLRASALDDALLDRLDACANGQWTRLEPAEIAFERSLKAFAPAKLPASLMASLESITAATPFPNKEAKILSFPEKNAAPKRSHRSGWAAAAAVAICGALTALMLPHGGTSSNLAGSSPVITPVPAASANALIQQDGLVPAGFNSGISETRDQGVVWAPNKTPHRVVRVTSMDKVTYTDASGRTYQIEKPRVDYILVPDKAD